MKSKLSPFLWSGLVMVLALVLALYAAGLEEVFFEENQFASPDVSLGPIVAYFFGVILVLAIILFFIPLRYLRLVFRALFAFMFGYGMFIISALTWPVPVAAALAVIAGVAWLPVAVHRAVPSGSQSAAPARLTRCA